MIDPKRLSKMIRDKKKRLMEDEPELVDTDMKPDYNPNDIQAIGRQADIEHSLDIPEHHSADDDQVEGDEGLEMGLTARERGRMARLRSYFSKLD